MLALMVPVGALLVQLWTFHVGLIRDKTTTYAYLRDLQQKNAEKMRKKRLGINASKKEKKKKKKKGEEEEKKKQKTKVKKKKKEKKEK